MVAEFCKKGTDTDGEHLLVPIPTYTSYTLPLPYDVYLPYVSYPYPYKYYTVEYC